MPARFATKQTPSASPLYSKTYVQKHIDIKYDRSYTLCMKTAISIPNETFDAAEHFASSTGMSRSELYAKAVIEYLNKYKYLDVTDTLNEIYAETDLNLDSELHSMQVKSLQKEKW